MDISTLKLDPDNAMTHDKKNLAAIKGSLKRFGQQKPIVVDASGIVRAGNGTLAAAKDLGWKEIAVHYSGLEADEMTAYALADNRTAQLAAWDKDVLGKSLKALKDLNFDLDAIGFDDKFFNSVVPQEIVEGLTDPDEIPEHVETRCKLGDLWILGNHRLLCGDSTDVMQVERLMGGEKADMVFTDPPYGMNLDTDYSGMKGWHSGKKYEKVKGDHEDFKPDLIHACFQFNCKEVFVWGADYYSEYLPSKNDGSWIVWDKRVDEAKDKMFGSGFELCWSLNRHQRRIVRKQWAGFMGDKEARNRVHPTQKPTSLAEYFLEEWGKGSKNIIDLFLGSGSTLIACEKTSRRCFGMELDPKYCDVIISRWERFTGKQAALES